MGSKPSSAKKSDVDVSSTTKGEIEFYWDPRSPPSRCVHMVLKALGGSFVEKKLDLFKGEHKTPEFLKINPEGKVPAIKHGNFSLGESRAIAMYLCNATQSTASKSLYPRDAAQRAKVDKLLLLSDEVNNAVMKQINLIGVMFRGEGQSKDEIAEAAKAMKIVADCLNGNKFVAGNSITIADFFMAMPFILYAMCTDQETLDKYHTYEGAETVIAWMGRIRGLPYFDEVNKEGTEQLGALYKSKLEALDE